MQYIVCLECLHSTNLFQCFQVNCEWSDWGEWSSCSITCGNYGNGITKRFRHITQQEQHGGEACSSTDHESRPCPHRACKRKCKKSANCACLPEDKDKATWIPRCPSKR